MPMPTTATGQPLPASLGRLAWATGLLQWLARLPPRLAALARRSPALAREHWLLTVLLAAGLGLRVLTQVAYRPALYYNDPTKYLFGGYPGHGPPRYQDL